MSKIFSTSIIRLRFQFLYFFGFIIAGLCYQEICLSQFSSLKFENISAKDGLSQNTVTSIQQDIYGFMWFGTFNGLNRYDGYDFKVYLRDKDNPRSLSSSRVTDMCADSADNLWVLTIDNVYNRYNYETDDFDHFPADRVSQQILNTFAKRNSEQIFQYSNYRFRFFYNVSRTFTCTDLSTGDSTNNVINLNDPYGIRDNYLLDLYIDRFHSLWVGSFSSGIFYADLQRKKFNHFLIADINSAENNIRSIYQNEDEKDILWLGTRDMGVMVFDRKTNRILRHYLHDPLNPNSLVYNDVRKIFRDSKGILWIGTKAGVDRFDTATGRFKNVMKGTGNDNLYYIFYIYEDHRGTIWIATFQGLHKYDEKTNSVIRFGEKDGVLAHTSIRFITEDTGYNLWLGTEVGGLTMLKRKPDSANKEKFESTQFMNEPGNDKSLSDNRLYSVCTDENGTMWFGTGAGLNKYDPAAGGFTVIGLNNGLPSDMILGILSDQKGHIWISHKRGISKIDIHDLSIMNYSVRDGLQDNEFNEDAYFRNPETGEMFFGGPKGFNSFFPGEITENAVPPDLMITDLLINGESVGINDTVNGRVILERNIILTKELELTNKEKSFSLVFAALNFANPANHKYAYMLEGFDKDWIYTDAKMRRASYTNLSPGTYTFKVKARNSDGLWSIQPAILQINVLPPFWATWWFRLILSVFIIGVTGFMFFFWLNRLKKTNLLLEEKVNQRTHELRESNEKITAQYQEIIDQNKIILHKNEEITVQSKLLEEQKTKIEKAFSELDLYRNKLEELVRERTKELVLAKEKAEESDRLKSSFVANLSHEIRTPLNAIIGFSSMLGEEEISNSERRLYNSIIQNSSNNLLELISDILDISQIESGLLKLTLRPVLLNTVITNMAGIFSVFLQRQNSYSNKNLALTINIGEALLKTEIITDAFRLEQILSNLLSNAIKFTEEGTIELGCTRLPYDDMLEFFVKDTGIGIMEEHQSIIFERFRKLEDDKTQLHRGTGLGLAISSQLVSLLGGTMYLLSQPGQGSAFYFTLPLIQSSAGESFVQTTKKGGVIPDLSNWHILVAEDDLSNYLYIEKLLKKTQARIMHAINGKEVLDILQAHDEIKLVLMDIKMPVMDGIESLQEMKKRKLKIPVIAQTAYAFADEIEKIKLAGFDDLITKPIMAANLYRIIGQCTNS